MWRRHSHPHGGLARSAWTALNEYRYGIRTAEYREHAPVEDGEAYSPAGFRLLRRTAGVLATSISADDVFYDLGCGKGRALAVMSRLPFARLVGVEVDRELAAAAAENMRRRRRRRAPIEIRSENVLDTDLDDGTVFFLDNPFGAATTRKLVRMLDESLSRHPRRLIIAYHNPENAEVLDGAGILERSAALSAGDGGEVLFWQSVRVPEIGWALLGSN